MATQRKTRQPRNRLAQEVCPVCRKPIEPGRGRQRLDGVRVHRQCWKAAVDRAVPG
jgi:hypothetical protein